MSDKQSFGDWVGPARSNISAANPGMTNSQVTAAVGQAWTQGKASGGGNSGAKSGGGGGGKSSGGGKK